MKISDAKSYPTEGMSLVYLNGENLIKQALFSTEKYGMFTRVGGRWRALAEKDESLTNLSSMDVLPEDYKVVTEAFDTSEKSGQPLKYEDVSQYEVSYKFEEKA